MMPGRKFTSRSRNRELTLPTSSTCERRRMPGRGLHPPEDDPGPALVSQDRMDVEVECQTATSAGGPDDQEGRKKRPPSHTLSLTRLSSRILSGGGWRFPLTRRVMSGRYCVTQPTPPRFLCWEQGDIINKRSTSLPERQVSWMRL